MAVALCVATASGSFIAALNHTSVARVLFILAVAPVLAALLARVTLGEEITRRTVIAMALALAGVTLMLGAPGEGSLAGDSLAFLAALAFATMIVITRWRHDVSMAPATCLSQVILVAAFLPFATPGEIDGNDGTLGKDEFLAAMLGDPVARARIFALSPGAPPLFPPSPFIATSAILRWLVRNAKYESGMSSKSMTRSHSSQRHVGGSCGGGPMSLASTSNTFSSSHSGQKYGT